MRKKNYKGRCNKQYIQKCKYACCTYDDVQLNYLKLLEENEEIVQVDCNVLLETDTDDEYTSDFVCKKRSGELMVRECVLRKFLTKPATIKMLDISREYWFDRGVSDWGLVIDADKNK